MKQSREENLLGKVRSIEIISTWYYVGVGTAPFKTNSQQTKYILLQTQN
jgi:hypothetical protein